MSSNQDLDYRAGYSAEFAAMPVIRLLLGDKRLGGTLFEGVANGNTKKAVIENNTSDKYLLVFEPTVRSSGQFFTNKTKNPTVDTVGSEVALVNPKTDESTPLDVRVLTAGDNETGGISGGTAYPQLTAGSGTNASNADPGESGGTELTDAIAPGDSLAIEATNKSGSTQDIGINLGFIVLPESKLDNVPS